jgi:hypothetical protein
MMRGKAMNSQPTYLVVPVLIAAALTGWPAAVAAQGTAADYARADALRARYENAAVDIAGPASTVGRTHRFWYRKATRGVEQFMMIDAETRQTGLQGDLLLVVGELDTNVDPSSTMQVVNQLIKHDKPFDLLVVPGANHPAGRGNDPTAPYGDRKRNDFFVRHLLGVNPPPWKGMLAAKPGTE